jgi:predicted CopG family antitoxin
MHCSCYHVSMKTITLSDEAYERLKDWKEGQQDSFSSVVLRLVPKRGTLADLLQNFAQLPPLTDEQVKIMEEAVAWANDWKNYRDPWADNEASTTARA